MNFERDFLSALLSCSLPDEELQPSLCSGFFLGGRCPEPPEAESLPILRPICVGQIQAKRPFWFELSSLEGYLLLHTTAGSGILRTGGSVLPLPTHSLLLLDCRTRFYLGASGESWSYRCFWVRSQALSQFHFLIPKEGILLDCPPCSQTALDLEQLLQSACLSSIRSALLSSSLLTGVITRCLVSLCPDDPLPPVPAYLEQLASLFRQQYAKSYTLDELSGQFHVNKYRLCREFHSHFGCSPIQYLNQQRILAAKKLLRTSDCRVCEAGRMVGIENTNHFIHLFKKFTGQTPAQYRASQNPV